MPPLFRVVGTELELRFNRKNRNFRSEAAETETETGKSSFIWLRLGVTDSSVRRFCNAQLFFLSSKWSSFTGKQNDSFLGSLSFRAASDITVRFSSDVTLVTFDLQPLLTFSLDSHKPSNVIQLSTSKLLTSTVAGKARVELVRTGFKASQPSRASAAQLRWTFWKYRVRYATLQQVCFPSSLIVW